MAHHEAAEARRGAELIIVGAVLEIELGLWVALNKSRIILQSIFGCVIYITGIDAWLKRFNESAAEILHVKSAAVCDRFQQHQGPITVMGLVAGLPWKMVMTFLRLLKAA